MRKNLRLVVISIVLFAAIATPFVVQLVQADKAPSADWFTKTPVIAPEADYTGSMSLGLDKCQPTNVQIQGQSGYSSLCMTPTAMGLMTSLFYNWGYVQANSYSKAFRVDYIVGGNPSIFPAPNQASGVYYGNSDYDGLIYMGLFYQLSNHMKLGGFPFGSSFSMAGADQTPDIMFTHPDNSPIRFDPQFNFSRNGRYLAASNNQGFMKINLMNPSIQFFSTKSSPSSAVTQSFLDDTGNLAAVVFNNFNDPQHSSFKLVDVSSCNVPTPVSRDTLPSQVSYSSCKTTELYPLVKQAIPTLYSINRVEFINDRTVTFIATYLDGGGARKNKYYSMTAGGQPRSLKTYLALGDSYISGEGAYDYRDGTDTELNRCHQSLRSYPYLLGANFSSFASVAWSGAKIQNIVQSGKEQAHQIMVDKPTDPQIDTAKASYLPGVIQQKDFVDSANPESVTISIGGNDIGFGEILERCVHPLKNLKDNLESASTCYDTYEDRLELVNLINSQFTRLRSLYESLKSNDTVGSRRVYVIGYPQIAKVDGDCGLNVNMNTEEIRLAHDLIDYLDSVIKKAADEAGVQYVDTQQAFDGHRLCEAAVGQYAVNGFTISNTVGGGHDFRASFHPDALGHQLLAQVIAAQTSSLTKPMPVPVVKTNQLVTDPDTAILQDVPRTNRVVRYVRMIGDLLPKVVSPGKLLGFTVKADNYFTRIGNVYDLVINSTPVTLGQFTADSNGDVHVNMSLPVGFAPGFHTVHIYGNDMFGNPIDLQQVVFVTASDTDSDGDGVPDDKDDCVLAAQSGIDADRDGIDDVCDPSIGVPPAGPSDEIIWAENATLTISIDANQAQASSGP